MKEYEVFVLLYPKIDLKEAIKIVRSVKGVTACFPLSVRKFDLGFHLAIENDNLTEVLRNLEKFPFVEFADVVPRFSIK